MIGGKRTPPVTERLCRAGCGAVFKLMAPDSPNAISQQTCITCMELLIEAMAATHPSQEEINRRSAERERAKGDRKRVRHLNRLGNIRMMAQIRQLREHRVEFEAAWRLGADAAHLRGILER